MSTSYQGEFSTVKRLAKRAVYDADVIHAILDEALVAHVAFIVEGRPVTIPTAFMRIDDVIYLHGSAANRMLRVIGAGADTCIAVTLLDGLVLARSAFHHSMNYRSVVVYGKGRFVEGEEADQVLDRFVDHIVPGRAAEVRRANQKELKQTLVVAVRIEQASAKVRTGPAVDDEEDYALPVWAGIVPLRLNAGEPIADERLPVGVSCPLPVARYRR